MTSLDHCSGPGAIGRGGLPSKGTQSAIREAKAGKERAKTPNDEFKFFQQFRAALAIHLTWSPSRFSSFCEPLHGTVMDRELCFLADIAYPARSTDAASPRHL